MKVSKKKVAAGLAAGAITLTGAGVAFAYWTTSGSGTGSGQAGTDSAVSLDNSVVTGNPTPDGDTGTVSFHVHNPASGPEYITSVSLASVDAYRDAAHTTAIPVGTSSTDCDTSQFSMDPVTVGHEVPTGDSVLAETGTLVLNDDASHNQDGCKGAYLVLNLTSS